MVRGLDRFRAHFPDDGDHYILIGGAAMWLVMDEAGLATRATHDLDIVLCIEALDSSFAERFWGFVRAGGYRVQERSSGEKRFYRFRRPVREDYPEMLELFSRKPDCQVLGEDAHLTPIPVEGEISSLSAILLDDDYYEFLHGNTGELNGVRRIDERCLIPLKAKAWLDLGARRTAGEDIDRREIRKHRNDVLRLYQLLEPESRIGLPAGMEGDLRDFLQQAGPDINADVLRGLGMTNVRPAQVMDSIRAVFGIRYSGGDRE